MLHRPTDGRRWPRTAATRRAAALVALLLSSGVGTAHAQDEALDRALARNGGLVGVQLVMAEVPRGLSMLANAASRGDALAQYNLGVAYAQGRVSGRPAPEAALRWYRRAAEQGYAAAAYNIGALFANGELGRVDIARATRWMRRAAGMRHAAAIRWLARRSEDG